MGQPFAKYFRNVQNLAARIERDHQNLIDQLKAVNEKNKKLERRNEGLETLLSTRARLDKQLPREEQNYISAIMAGEDPDAIQATIA